MSKLNKKGLLALVAEIDPEAAEQMRGDKKTTAKIVQLWLDGVTEQGEDDGEEEEEGKRGMAGTLAKYRDSYQTSVSASGRKSLNNGDKVAAILEGKEADEVLSIAEKLLGFEKGELSLKYERLNNGQRRMNGGNRIRSAIKRGDHTVAQLEAATH